MMKTYSNYDREELIRRIKTLETKLAKEESSYSRRSVIRAAAGIAAAGALGVYATGNVDAAPTGTYPKLTADPLLKIRADRVRLIGRTSDPSTPDNGTMWYRSDL